MTAVPASSGGLGGEKTRWGEAAASLWDRYGNIMGDVLLSAGVVAYLGPFTVDYRQVRAQDGSRRYNGAARHELVSFNHTPATSRTIHATS